MKWSKSVVKQKTNLKKEEKRPPPQKKKKRKKLYIVDRSISIVSLK